GTHEDGLFQVRDGRMQPVAVSARGDGEPVAPSMRALVLDREGNLWVGTDGDGLYRLTRRSIGAHLPADGPRTSFVPIVGDGAGGIWAGATCGGLFHYRD